MSIFDAWRAHTGMAGRQNEAENVHNGRINFLGGVSFHADHPH